MSRNSAIFFSFLLVKPGGGLYQYFPLVLNWVSSGFFLSLEVQCTIITCLCMFMRNHHMKIPFGNVLSNTGTSRVIAASGIVLTSLSCLCDLWHPYWINKMMKIATIGYLLFIHFLKSLLQILFSQKGKNKTKNASSLSSSIKPLNLPFQIWAGASPCSSMTEAKVCGKTHCPGSPLV